VYSNCDQVRLVLNENELDLRERNIDDFPACGFHWDVNFQKGNNELTAIGYSDGQEVTRHAIELNYSTTKFGKPEELLLSADQLANGNYLIKARIVDKHGQTCLDFNERVYFDHNGTGSLKVNLGTPNGSNVIECANGRAAIEYVPDEKGSAVIEARTQDFKGTYIHFPLTNK
jgi:beta-galactosidase